MKVIKFLSIVFENCESFVLPIDRVRRLSYGKLTKLTDSLFTDGDYYETDYLSLQIKYQDESDLKYNDADYPHPLGMFIDNPTSNNVTDRPNIIGRILNHNDIVSIQFMTGEKEGDYFMTIYAPWGEEEWINTCMDVVVEDGLVKIEIKE